MDARAALEPQYLRALVDMGSNGIRFSISNMEPLTARIMPTLYQSRAAVSLYDAQYSPSGERIPIPDDVIADVIASFKSFKRTCEDFGVPETQIKILATEATRTAVNSEALRQTIKDQLGPQWEVTMLAKEEEGRIGASGIGSSLHQISGLIMDLGGGSTQLSWGLKRNGREGMSLPLRGAVSLPYGAAAMSRRLAEANQQGHSAVQRLRNEIQTNVRNAYQTLSVPEELEQAANSRGGFTMFLSGGGFRGWGYVLMSQHSVSPYPVPVINGFKASREEFLNTEAVQASVSTTEDEEDEGIFRVSDRRASQVPAVAFLIQALAGALPQIKEVRFCQGGVREGYLFSAVSADTRMQSPVVVATLPFASTPYTNKVVEMLEDALPPNMPQQVSDLLDHDMLTAFANLMYHHASHPKDLQTTSALRSTTTGVLASAHGLSHEVRIVLALLLAARWGGEVPPSDEPFKQSLERLVMLETPILLWWIRYVGAIADLLATVYPAGIPNPEHPRVAFSARWEQDGSPRQSIALQIVLSESVAGDLFQKEVHAIEKLGKKKRWVGGRDGVGHKINVVVERPRV